MLQVLLELGLFTGKAIIILLLILLIFIAFFSLLAKTKDKLKGRLIVKNLNEKHADNIDIIQAEILSKGDLKAIAKTKKALQKAESKSNVTPKRIYVLNFHGDIRATSVPVLCEEVNAILNVATPSDEVVLRLESPGGVVHGYGLAAAQLMRLRAKNIPLTVAVDKVAASGGYLMACIANKILAAPFAIIGSIGVLVQLPNFNRLLKDKNIDFEQITAGEYKRTISLFGENTDEGRQKLKEEVEDIHEIFTDVISTHRKEVDIHKVATGEHWMGIQALDLKLVDEIKTSDDYLLDCCKTAKVYEICYEVKKPFLSKFSASASMLREKLLGF